MKTIIAGSRTVKDFVMLASECDKLLVGLMGVSIISGGAEGTDRLGERYARERNLPVKVMKADWRTYGKIAGYIRNEKMAQEADMLIAFWDGESRGTSHMIKEAHLRNLTVHVIDV